MNPAKDFNLLVGLRIREIREAAGLTREQFSEMCDISESFLTSVEQGQKASLQKLYIRFAQVLIFLRTTLFLGEGKGMKWMLF